MPDEPLLYQCLHVTERPNRPAHGTRRHLCEPTPGTSISRAVVEHTRALMLPVSVPAKPEIGLLSPLGGAPTHGGWSRA